MIFIILILVGSRHLSENYVCQCSRHHCLDNKANHQVTGTFKEVFCYDVSAAYAAYDEVT